MVKNKILTILFFLAVLGIADTSYLTYEHYRDTIPPCTTSPFIDCGQVLRSEYATLAGIPLALLGLFYYLTITLLILLINRANQKLLKNGIIIISFSGFVFSAYLMYIQFFVIGALCLYCTLSAVISAFLFLLIQHAFPNHRKGLLLSLNSFVYRNLVKHVLFLVESETIHDFTISSGNKIGASNFVKSVSEYLFLVKLPALTQSIENIKFENPIGLAAGFDYDANLTQFLPSLGFGFATVGTITNMPYQGNPKPRLGRLPNSKALLVNKGFKSSGAKSVSKRLKKLDFNIPIGISIGRTNSPKLKNQKQSVADIIKAFKVFERANITNSFYELNISCPNLIYGKNITFYPPKNLNELLTEVDKLKLNKPIFVKMPITESNSKTLKMLEVIARHSPKGVIFGNLQKDKKHPGLDPNEVKQFKKGNFSGKPTFDRSNELIKLAYQHYKKRFVIVGCGGVFSAEDAYEKILLGASLVQLITGLIYEGPQLIGQLNLELNDLLVKDGFPP